MNVESLYPLVTEAILRAETLEDIGAPGAPAAFLDVSLLEEKIANALPAADPEGELARRGAVRAALTARDFSRARQLAERYLAETEITPQLKEQLRTLASQVATSSAARFPYVSNRFGLDEVRRLAQEYLHQQAPFPFPIGCR